ncbi:MAG: type II secretion system protein GspD [Planctomycetes bacterium]|nr:type II secretion system protein GspD [Planctomycetota bacterium]
MPTSNLIGQIRFIPVARSKAILVLAPPEYLEDIKAMIAELDQPGMQVMIKVVIVEVNHSSMTSLGVQFATGSSMVNAYTENGVTIFSALDYVDNFLPWTLETGMSVNTLVDLLVKKVNAKILNQPTLWTKDNEEAVFIKGKRVAFITNAQSDSSNITAVNQSYNYDDVGLTLRVRPNITPEKAVDMTINLIISQVDAEEINDEVAVSNLDTTTHLIINNGQTIMLGGILFQNESSVKRKVPLLGDIPVIGNLFRHTETDLTNDELLVFVTPYVIDANSLEVLPVDTDTDAQLHEPFRKMEKIRGQLDKAMDWLAAEIDENDYDDDTNEDEPQGDDAIIEIKTDEPGK